ncbi:MAG TPA: hypothetical protein HA319_04135 [Nitrosopumilaceae archaeon]|nr:hypothetical protein [Nitrosopumilaceae archaeon]
MSEEFHKEKNTLFADILIFFNKEPESFYMFPDELIIRLNKLLEKSKQLITKQ